MKKWIGIIGALAFIGLAVAVLVYVFVINKPHRDYEKANPDYFMTAEALFGLFREDAQAASEMYNGKIIQVSGQLSSVENVDGQIVLCFVLGEGLFGDEGIRISMISGQVEQPERLVVGQDITLKGFCTGFNDTDVVMSQGSIIN
jgi:hypothetical protein